jgi:hypothetical protein
MIISDSCSFLFIRWWYYLSPPSRHSENHVSKQVHISRSTSLILISTNPLSMHQMRLLLCLNFLPYKSTRTHVKSGQINKILQNRSLPKLISSSIILKPFQVGDACLKLCLLLYVAISLPVQIISLTLK